VAASLLGRLAVRSTGDLVLCSRDPRAEPQRKAQPSAGGPGICSRVRCPSERGAEGAVGQQATATLAHRGAQRTHAEGSAMRAEAAPCATFHATMSPPEPLRVLQSPSGASRSSGSPRMVTACIEPLRVRAVGSGLRRVVRGASPRAHAGRVVRVGLDVRKNPHDHHITPRSLGACDAPRTTRRADLFPTERCDERSPPGVTHDRVRRTGAISGDIY
jgi:hypothetical protein